MRSRIHDWIFDKGIIGKVTGKTGKTKKQVMILKSEDLPAMVHMATSNWFVHTRDNV